MFQEETRETAPAHHMTSPRGTGAGPNGKRKWPTGVQALGPHSPGHPRQTPGRNCRAIVRPRPRPLCPDRATVACGTGKKEGKEAAGRVSCGGRAPRERRTPAPAARPIPARSPALGDPLCQRHCARTHCTVCTVAEGRRLFFCSAECAVLEPGSGLCGRSAQCAGGRSVSVAPRGANWPGVHSQPLLSVLYSPPWSRTQPRKAHITGIICTTA